jgi:UDP-glucose 4-epimerase
VLNVATGQSTTLIGLVAILNRLLGTSLEPTFAAPRAGDIRHSLADLTQARQCLGYRPRVGLEEGLRRTIAHCRQELELRAELSSGNEPLPVSSLQSV